MKYLNVFWYDHIYLYCVFPSVRKSSNQGHHYSSPLLFTLTIKRMCCGYTTRHKDYPTARRCLQLISTPFYCFLITLDKVSHSLARSLLLSSQSSQTWRLLVHFLFSCSDCSHRKKETITIIEFKTLLKQTKAALSFCGVCRLWEQTQAKSGWQICWC